MDDGAVARGDASLEHSIPKDPRHLVNRNDIRNALIVAHLVSKNSFNNVYQLLCKKLPFKDHEKLFSIDFTPSASLGECMVTAEDYVNSIKGSIDDSFEESVILMPFASFYERVILFHPVSHRPYLEWVARIDPLPDREPGGPSHTCRDYFMVCAEDDERTENYRISEFEDKYPVRTKDLHEVSRRLVQKTLLVLSAMGLIFSFTNETNRIKE